MEVGQRLGHGLRRLQRADVAHLGQDHEFGIESVGHLPVQFLGHHRVLRAMQHEGGQAAPPQLGEDAEAVGTVGHGALGEDDDLESLTLVRGKLETHISVATRDGSLTIIIDNTTGKTQITDENQLVLRADPNDHLHYDHQELAPLPPPSQG